MTETGEPTAEPVRGRRGQRRPRPPVTVLGVLGEVLITAGVLVLLFIGWQLWWNDTYVAGEQSKAAADLSNGWIAEELKARDPKEPAQTPADFGDPVVAEAPGAGKAFAVLYVPRFGAEYHRTIAEGVGVSVLNSTRLGIGHYPDTQMPGEVGNFAVAAHRSAYGGGMHLINELRLGDAVYVQTADGYFTYRFRDLEYVAPTAVAVLAPVPGVPDRAATDAILTLTSCNPLYSTAERIIAYGVFESWQPTSAGPPAELAPIIAAQAKG